VVRRNRPRGPVVSDSGARGLCPPRLARLMNSRSRLWLRSAGVRNRSCKVPTLKRTNIVTGKACEDSTMPHSKRTSKRKRRNEAVPMLGAVGVSLSLASGASAAPAVPAADTPSRSVVPPQITLNEEEISDVSLGTFYVFDKENAGISRGLQLAQRGCGRCGGCRGCRGCGRGCGCGGCGGCGCGGCGCCWSWGYCRLC
jgi:hypothetical protein